MADNSSHDEDRSSGISRRKWLQVTAAASAVGGVAGCGGDGGGDGGTTTTEENQMPTLQQETQTETETETEMEDGEGTETETETETETDTPQQEGEMLDSDGRMDVGGAKSPQPVDQLHTNLFNPANNIGGQHNIMELTYFDETNVTYGANPPFPPSPLADWEKDGTTWNATIHEDQTWHTGEDLTARDMEIQFRILEFYDDAIWTFIDDIVVDGTKEFHFELADDWDNFIWLTQLNLLSGFTPESIYGEWLERLQDATTDDARNQVLGDLTSFKVKRNDDGVFPNGNGLFQPVELNSATGTWEKWEDHPHADVHNWDRMRFYHEEPTKQIQRLQPGSNVLDILGSSTSGWVPPSEREQWSDKMSTFPFARPKYNSFNFNHNHKHLGKRKVRQALAYLFDRAQQSAALWSGNEGAAVPVLHGLNDAAFGNWESELSDIEYIDYPIPSTTDQAAEKLREVGWTKESGQWLDSDGEAVEWEFVSPPAESLTAMVDIGAATLTNFGIPTENRNIPGSRAWGGVYNGEALETSIAAPHGGRGNPTVFAIMNETWTLRRPSQNPGIPAEIQLPETPGDPSSSKTTVNVVDLIDSLKAPESDQAAAEAVRTLTWGCNYYLPAVPIMDDFSMVHNNTAEWETGGSDFPLGWNSGGQPWNEGVLSEYYQAKLE